MKKLYTLAIVTILFCFPSYAQGWEKVGEDSNTFGTNRGGIESLLYDNGNIYAAGVYHGLRSLAKLDGVSWEEFGASANMRALCIDKEHNLYTPGIESTGRWYVMKWNGAQLSELGTGPNTLTSIREIFAICTDKDGNVYAAGAINDKTDSCNVVKWDGTSWSNLGTGSNALNANGRISTIAADSHGNIYASGDFTRSGYSYVAKWDGNSWGQVGAGDDPFNTGEARPAISAMYIDNADNIYAAMAQRYSYNFVAKWNGSSWADMGNRYREAQGSSYKYKKPVFYMPVEVITGDKAGNIYIGGEGVEDSISGRNCVMKWSGTRWVQIGTGRSSLSANDAVTGICVDTSGYIYAAGRFTDSGIWGYGYNYVARYNTLNITTQISGIQPINAWPNPANNFLSVKGTEFNENIYICDISGAVKKTIINRTAPSGTTPVIDISDLAPGSYFLRSKDCVPFFFSKN